MNDKPTIDNETGDTAAAMADPQALARNMLRIFEESGKVVAGAIKQGNSQGGPYSMIGEMGEAAKIMGTVAQKWMTEPAKAAEAQSQLMQGYAELWGRSVQSLFGQDVRPVAEPQPGDNRFRDADWSESPYFSFWKQAYLLTSQWAEEVVDKTDGLDDRTKQKAEFYVNLITNALSPSNFVPTNPEVVRETLATNGENLVNGLSQLAADLERSDDLFRISQTDHEAFEVGKNLAITPGKVVFQNDIIQLIQYTPTTKEVREVPLLIVPPWINKYYILDLVPKKSFIKWVVDQGFTVFTISWVDPDEQLSHKTFEDYMEEGVLAATGAVLKATGAKKVNALGYCVGGTLLSVALAYMAATGDDRIGSATFLTTQVDFEKAGDLLVFIDEAQLASLEEMMSERGFLDGSRMATVFNLMRSRDLIWPYVVNNYLLGKKPFPFDLLYWNSDSTRMPAANHSFYLREFYKNNTFAKGGLEIKGHQLSLSDIKIPVYELATREDHIAPAASCYKGAKLFGGPVRFVLAGSGHIAGVVNPPDKKKYQHWTPPRGDARNLEAWINKATEHEGSWWPDWSKWLAKKSGETIKGRTPGRGRLKAIEDAPGSYVKGQAS